MRARVKANSPIANVRACVGRIFTKEVWIELPDGFLEEVRTNDLLEIEAAYPVVEPDEQDGPPAEQIEPKPTVLNFDVVLAGNAFAVKEFVGSMNNASDLELMRVAEAKGKARKSVLFAIKDRQVEIGVSE
jgi:hypothetical protein